MLLAASNISDSIDGIFFLSFLNYINDVIIYILLVTSSNILGIIYGIFALSTLEHIKDVIISLIEIIVGSLVLIFLFRLLIFLSTKNEEIIILPFEVSTSKKTYNGNIISDFLVVELRKIKEIHDHKFEEEGIVCEDISLLKLAPSTEKLETAVSNLGNVSIAGMTLSVGSILTVLKRLWPGGQARTIKGSLQEYDSEIHLIALMEGPKVYGWELSHKIKQTSHKIGQVSLQIEQSTSEDKIPELIKDLAFMITYDLSKGGIKKKEKIMAKTWISLKYFTHSLNYYSQYKVTKKPEHLENAWNNCIKASQEEKDYHILFNLFYSLGFSYYDNGDYYSAEDAFRRCITLMPENGKGFIGLSAPLFNLGRYEETLRACEQALDKNSKDAIAWSNKGFALYKLGRDKEALIAHEKALRIHPKNAEDALAWSDFKRSNSSRYLKACEQALLTDSNDAIAWSGKGAALVHLERYEKALEALEEALNIDSKDVISLFYKGFALNKLGRRGDALETLEKALEIDSSDADVWFYKACVYSLMNRKKEALKDLKCAIERDSSYREWAKDDTDFEKLWKDNDFKEIVTANEVS